ncbi:hypothetical protein BU26DRAFT_546141 [Trematosphaeria pertusa]|uniref:Uncharacterized protein n=1 Tax=Trematosphaeria pertusa TaxID=390896 RepID=A0A6A6J417_9PLEO|nr:uncharacterized protein BU26DRAFT_546141 [Trematosphaeria pertusa]KAF2256952.1 hypothetical protein BU26DRAFT_546141 [Trematosphaeria pertusa]
MPSPASEETRKAVQSRIQGLLTGQHSRHPELSNLSTGRLILEGVVEGVKVYRLHKEEEARKAGEHSKAKEKMTSAAFKGLYKKPQQDHRGRHRSRSRESEHGRAHEGHRGRHRSTSRGRHGRSSRDDDQESHATGSLVSGATNRNNQDPHYMMAGGAGPAGTAPPDSQYRSPRSHHGSHQRSSSEPPARKRSRRRQRYGADGRPLVLGSRGWRDAKLGPPPKYKFKWGLTFGFGTHVKNMTKYLEEEKVLKARRAERRARGTLDERREGRRKRRAEEKDEEKEIEGRDRNREGHGERDEAHRSHGSEHGGSQRRERSEASSPPHSGNYGSRRRGRSPPQRPPPTAPRSDNGSSRRRNAQSEEYQPTPQSRESRGGGANEERKAKAEAKARSRGEQLARSEARARSPSVSHHDPHAHAHFEDDPRVRDFAVSDQASVRHASPNHQAYRETRHSREVEDEERAQAQSDFGDQTTQGKDALSSRGPPHASESDESDVINRDADHAQDRNNTASTMVTDWWSNRPDTPSDDESIVVNRDADHAQDQNNTASTMVTDWWSNRSDTPSDRGEQDDTGYFSDGLVEELRRRTGSGSGSATPRPAGSSGGAPLNR